MGACDGRMAIRKEMASELAPFFSDIPIHCIFGNRIPTYHSHPSAQNVTIQANDRGKLGDERELDQKLKIQLDFPLL